MPISLDPEARVDVCLPADERIPAAQRPTFIGRFASLKTRRRIARLLDDVDADGVTADQQEQMLEAGLKEIFPAWRNMGEAAIADGFAAVLTLQEMYDLIPAWLAATRLGESDRKNSSSPVPSSTGSSAPDAPATNALALPTDSKN